MWLWEWELQQLGFRRLSATYWQCAGRYGLPENAYLSLFADSIKAPGSGRRSRRAVEVGAFHVTFLMPVDNVHFYYHERAEHLWEPGGYTSTPEIERHGVNPRLLRQTADVIAARMIEASAGQMLPRRRRRRE